MCNVELETILDSCIAEIQAGRATQADCLQRYADHATALEPLLREATRLMTLPPAVMSDEAVHELEQRVLGRAAEMRTLPLQNGLSVWTQFWSRLASRASDIRESSLRSGLSVWRQFWSRLVGGRTRLLPATLSLVIALTVASTWVVSVSAASLPGTTLYPVKLATERARLAVTFRHGTRAHLHLSFAEQRLGETQALLAAQKPVASSLLEALAVETTLAVEAIEEMPASRQAWPVVRLLALTERQQAVLASVPAADEAERGLSRALSASQQGRDRAMTVLDTILESTPIPLRHPSATPTPSPHVKPTRRPTHTPRPTQTPRATQTAKPSHTPKPTHTPRATRTPRPTHTPRPAHILHGQPTRKPTPTPRPTKTPKVEPFGKPADRPRPTRKPQDTSKPERGRDSAPGANPNKGGNH